MNTKEIEVTLEQITDWKKENVVYIDTRGAIAYQHGHIENAQVFENMDVVKEQIPYRRTRSILYTVHMVRPVTRLRRNSGKWDMMLIT